ncbi:MAG: hypothetical protein HONBIEJF_00695 [Fimbriimonadaceae bacterium]|nr:hypothetical protein [Fimbriimonadaceae bacterium]
MVEHVISPLNSAVGNTGKEKAISDIDAKELPVGPLLKRSQRVRGPFRAFQVRLLKEAIVNNSYRDLAWHTVSEWADKFNHGINVTFVLEKVLSLAYP